MSQGAKNTPLGVFSTASVAAARKPKPRLPPRTAPRAGGAIAGPQPPAAEKEHDEGAGPDQSGPQIRLARAGALPLKVRTGEAQRQEADHGKENAAVKKIQAGTPLRGDPAAGPESGDLLVVAAMEESSLVL
jgi:hypothetical protein